MNKLWLILVIGGLASGCGQVTKKKVVESKPVAKVERKVVEDETTKTYSEALEDYRYYIELTKSISYKGDLELMNAYADSAVVSLYNSTIGNYSFVDIKGDTFDTRELSKPLYLTTSASWCKPCIAKIPALNVMVDQYKESIDFVVLFQDIEDVVVDMSEDYHEGIRLIASTPQGIYETWNISEFEPLQTFPTTYLINQDKMILRLGQGAEMARTYQTEDFEEITVTEQEAFDSNYQSIRADVEELLASNHQGL